MSLALRKVDSTPDDGAVLPPAANAAEYVPREILPLANPQTDILSNAAYEVENGSSSLGKPYEPNSVIKNDIEFLLMERKPGGYRNPDTMTRVLSLIPEENHGKWFQQIWTGLTGASTRRHPAPFPLELAERLIRMFSFVGDTVLDPFLGTGTTTVAAAKTGRHSIGIEVDDCYFDLAHKRIANETFSLFSQTTIFVRKAS